jgi:hypothetical protein
MSIDELGMSLLAKQDKRREESIRRDRKFHKRARRTQLFGAAANIAVNIGNKVLAQKAEDFLNSEQVYNQKIKYKNATNSAERIKSQEQIIRASGFSTQAFFEDQSRSIIRAQADELYAEERLDKDAYSRYIREQAAVYGKEMALQHDEALKRADRVISSDSYDNIIKMANNRPKNVGEYVIDLFRGKSKRNIDDEAFEAIKNHAATKNADEFIEFFEGEYNRTKDLVQAHDFANKVFPGIVSKTFKDTTYSTKVAGNQLIMLKETSFFDTASHQWLELDNAPFNVVVTKEVFDMSTPAEIDISLNKVIKAFNDNFNYGVRGHAILTTAGFQLFRELVPEAIHIERITNAEDLETVSTIWAKVVANDDNLKSAGKDAVAEAVFDMVTTTLPYELRAFFAAMEKDPERAEELNKELILTVAKFTTLVQQGLGGVQVGVAASVGKPGSWAGKIMVKDHNQQLHPFDTQAQADAFQEELDRIAAAAGL